MAVFLTIIAFLLLILGLVGAVVPVLPGPPLGYLGLWCLQWSGFSSFSPRFMWIWAGIVLVVTLADYYLPVWMVKKFGGPKRAVYGSAIGLIIGIFFFPPLGLIIGPFLGALIGELTSADAESGKALKAAFGSFVAFIAGTGAKLIASAVMLFYAIYSLF